MVSTILDSIPEDERTKLMSYEDTSDGGLNNRTIDVIELAFDSGHQDTVKLLEKYGAVLPKVSAVSQESPSVGLI